MMESGEHPEASAGTPCPRCGAGAERRIEAAGFGPIRPIVCGRCGLELEVRREETRDALPSVP